jgi:hypothetical protein
MFGRVPQGRQRPLFDVELLGLGLHSQSPDQVVGERNRQWHRTHLFVSLS